MPDEQSNPEASAADAPIDDAPIDKAPVDKKTSPKKEPDAKEPSESDIPPDRLSINPLSRHYDEEKLKRGIGIRFKGKERKNVQEYCVSQGWVQLQAGKALDRRGQPLTIKSNGPVEAWYEDLGDDPPVAKAE